MTRLPIVGVMGSGTEPYAEQSIALGGALARLGVHLLTGGGGGVMREVSRAFCETPGRIGLAIGVLPGRVLPGRVLPGGILPGGILPASSREKSAAPPGYPNPWVEIPIATHLPHSGARGREQGSRNHINILSSDAVVALPGSAGTASEVALAVEYGRPVLAFLEDRTELIGLPDEVRVVGDIDAVVAFLREVLDGSLD